MTKKKPKRRLKPEIYVDSITYICPVRGEVTQIVNVQKYPYVPQILVNEKELEEISELLSLSELVGD
jgi:hypothetical protein